MRDSEKLENLKGMLDTLITTCKSEISITDKIILKTSNTREKSKLQKEKAFWQGKLEVAEYVKYFAK
ncbi:hypothetical protein [Romboutsia lituseburensis]|uniref:hypothetical protein n=1 Tax=Romboutsia lituseburensis TaxID=1537 RepID=UPI0022EA33F0|nr:hypothetical protein [Romboutsia lituseburensis]